jgi:hypothetical protein
MTGIQEKAGYHHVELTRSFRIHFDEVSGYHSEVPLSVFGHFFYVHVRNLHFSENIFYTLTVVEIVDIRVDAPLGGDVV